METGSARDAKSRSRVDARDQLSEVQIVSEKDTCARHINHHFTGVQVLDVSNCHEASRSASADLILALYQLHSDIVLRSESLSVLGVCRSIISGWLVEWWPGEIGLSLQNICSDKASRRLWCMAQS
jgi:hypothetical protein